MVFNVNRNDQINYLIVCRELDGDNITLLVTSSDLDNTRLNPVANQPLQRRLRGDVPDADGDYDVVLSLTDNGQPAVDPVRLRVRFHTERQQ